MAFRATADVHHPIGFVRRAVYLLGPLALSAALIAGIRVADGERVVQEVLIVAAASLMGAGTTVVFGKAAVGSELFQVELETWDLAVIVMYVNAASAFWYTFNLDLIGKLPGVGPWFRQARRNSVATLRQRPWIRRWAVVGIGLFVLTPLPGSGALGGSLIGRIVGVSRLASWISISLSGVVVCSAYALAAGELEQLGDRLERFLPPWVRFAVALLAVIVMFWVMAKLLRWFASHPPGAPAERNDADVTPG